MSKVNVPFDGKVNFENECFYYFLNDYTSEEKRKVGEKIVKFKGVKHYLILYKKIFLL